MRPIPRQITRPFRIIRKKARAFKNESVTGRFIAKRLARYRRKLRQFFALQSVAPDSLAEQQPVSYQAATAQAPFSASDVSEGLQGGVAANDKILAPCSSDQVLDSIKYFANPGPGFEAPSELDSSTLTKRVKAIAFYLPQFHAFEENDAWWGEGFTEWRNVGRGAPRFAGHYQPRIPRDLGHYNLNSSDTLRAQAKMASRFGIEAFCFYYYWFNGKRLMEKPLDSFVDDEQITQNFCIMWANENWTRTWDGHENNVLIGQDYRESDEADFIADTARYMAHERYLRVDGRPLFILYRPGLLPEPALTLKRWRDQWSKILGIEPLILMVQGFEDNDPRKYALDGAIEFPPHKVSRHVPDMNSELTLYDSNFKGHVRDYQQVVEVSVNEPPSAFPLIKTASPHWDNDARREGRGMVLHGSTPERFERWMNKLAERAIEYPFFGEPLVFINAWNEWAESAYMEPDVHYGHAYLNAAQRAVHGLSALVNTSREQGSGVNTAAPLKRILLVGHDAHKHGAQMLLLSLATLFTRQFGMQVTVFLKGGGELVKEYEAVANTRVLEGMSSDALQRLLAEYDHQVAICNTCVTGDLVPELKDAGIRVVSLIHEMPNLIEEYGLQGHVALIDRYADHVIFPSEIVRRGFHQFSRRHGGEQHIKPQGTYLRITYDEVARERIRSQLELTANDKVVLNVGYADLRKGFDLFLQTALQWLRVREDVHFVWVGAISHDMQRWVQSDLAHSELASRIHLIGFTPHMSDYYSAADVLFLSSREDPYPTVVLEAMNIGLPAVMFRGATGFDEVMQRHGFLVERGDPDGLTGALSKAIDADTADARQARIEFVETNCQLDDYCFELLRLLRPELQKVSVVVPNYNYESCLPDRLATVFNQDMPVFEVIVLDDNSTDSSVRIINESARVAQRDITLIENATNSGNVFRQWQRGLSLCRGSHVWIAEADDLALPQFLSRSLGSFKSDTRLSFTDSRQVDGKGLELADSYRYYLDIVHPTLFSESFVMEGREFVERALSSRNVILNVSSVVWEREHLQKVLCALGEELSEYSLVGDWRLYIACLGQSECSVAYIAESLNVHRRHAESVTHALDLQHHLDEILSMHDCALDVVDTPLCRKQQADYEIELRQQFNLPATSCRTA